MQRARPSEPFDRLIRSVKAHLARALVIVVSLCGISIAARAQNEAAAEQIKKSMQEAQSAGTPLSVRAPSVDSSVNIEAVMLPSPIVNRVFGKEVSDHYAVIEINIANRSNSAGFILQSLFIDYSRWALAHPVILENLIAESKDSESRASTQKVSSVEYRIVRGQLLDKQPWTKRNMTFRTIKVLGSIGTAFAFPFSTDVVTGIGAWNGAVVPGFEALFPDGMEGQMNRLSDYGFRNNKIVPQQSADIVIAFFPIERFLSPGLKGIFLKSPALFFNPLLMALDPSTRKSLMPILTNALGDETKVKDEMQDLMKKIAELNVQRLAELQQEVQTNQAKLNEDGKLQTQVMTKLSENADEKAAPGLQASYGSISKAFNEDSQRLEESRRKRDELLDPLRKSPLFNFLSQISLSNINIVVSGVMTVDQLTVPASIESTCLDKGGPDIWAVAGKKNCFIRGRFLTNAIPQITGVDPSDLGIDSVSVDKQNSTPELLKFTFNLKAPLNAAVSDVSVSKADKDGAVVESMKYRVTSSYILPPPVIEQVVTEPDGTVAVSGTGFYSNPAHAFSLGMTASGSDQVKVVTDTPPSDPTRISLGPTSLTSLATGCYKVTVNVGNMHAVSPAAQLARIGVSLADATVKRDGSKIVITIHNLSKVSACNQSIRFVFLDADRKPIGTSLTPADGTLNRDGEGLTYDLKIEGQAKKVMHVQFSGDQPIVKDVQ